MSSYGQYTKAASFGKVGFVSLLHDIQATAIKADEDIAVLLRQCKVLAAKLGNQEFKQWLDWELNGYTSIETLPPYRILAVQSRGNFVGPFQSECAIWFSPRRAFQKNTGMWPKRLT